jgi:GNAT superfamily N-acetyltransferase
MRNFDAEIERFLSVYNRAWERNWGFCPMTDDEIRDHAKQLKPILDPNLVFVAEEGDEVAGVGLTIPDVNEALIHARGRLGPASAIRLLWKAKRRRWTACRVFALGVRSEYRRTGIGAHLYLDTLAAAKRGGYRWGEMSWILESNEEMNRAIRHMGGVVYKTYRMYSRPLA